MRTLLKGLGLLVALLSLVSCGGSGGGLSQATAGPKISLAAMQQSLSLNYPLQLPTANNLGAGSQFRTVVTATVTDATGQPLVGTANNKVTVQFSIAPTDKDVAGLYPTDFKDRESGTNDPIMFWSYPVDVAAGKALIQVQGLDQVGTATVYASVSDPTTGQVASASLPITVNSSACTGGPSVIGLDQPGNTVYVSGIGATDTGILTTTVRDSCHQMVADPSANNLRLEIVSGPNGGEQLEATDFSGATVTGRSINVASHAGISQVTLRAGTLPGMVAIRATVDRDNNVDNGIANPTSDSISVSISDGKLASLQFTGAYANAVMSGASSYTPTSTTGTVVTTNNTCTSAGSSSTTVTAFCNGVYQRVLSVIATTADGQPVPAGTQIQFSLVDAPIINYPLSAGTFLLSGLGDPQEGGVQFSAPGASAGFKTNSVTPLIDRLVLDGKDDGNPNLLNDFHTGIWTIASVPAETQLTVTTPFNAGYGDTGATVPYVVGHARYATILSPSYTDAKGVATTLLTYPMTRVGQVAALVATGPNGVGAVLNTGKSTYLPDTGVAGNGLALTSSATAVTPNVPQEVTMCLRDASNQPVPAKQIDWTVNSAVGTSGGAVSATVTVNGGNPVVTGDNGCVTFTILAQPKVGSGAFNIVFGNPAEESALVNVTVLAQTVNLVAQASIVSGPATCSAGDLNNTTGYRVGVTLLDAFGNKLPNNYITIGWSPAGVPGCGIGITFPDPPLTDADGKLSITGISVQGAPPSGAPATSTATNCTMNLSTLGGGGTVTLTLPSCI